MKKIILFCFIVSNGIAQEWAKNLPSNATYEQEKSAFYNYYKNVPLSWIDDDEYVHFKRYEALMESRSKVPTNINPSEELWKAYQKLNNNHSKTSQTSTANWSIVGPTNQGPGMNGMGRLSCIAFDPNNVNVIWVGSASGGLWKSTTGGTSWTSMSNGMPVLGISDIVVDQLNTNNIYVATGDKRGPYSLGVMKSTDGGNTWNPTGLNYSLSQGKHIYRLIMHPTNSNILFAAASDGIWYTNDAGVTWTLVKTGFFWDIEFNTSNANILYGAADSVYTSINSGLNWTSFPTSPTFTVAPTYYKTLLSVTPANSNCIYVLNNNIVYKSTDAGSTWAIANTTYSLYGYPFHTQVLTISTTNANEVFYGGYFIYRSTDGGVNYNIFGPNGLHGDQQEMAIKTTGTVTTHYSLNDGGLFKTTDGGATWNNLCDGLQTLQYYRLGCSANSKTLLSGGTQDNGSNLNKSGIWNFTTASDGAETFIDYNDSNTIYTTELGHLLLKSVDAGATFSVVLNDTIAPLLMPYIMHPTNNQIIFSGGKWVRKTMDGGATWNVISPAIGYLNAMNISKSNPNTLCATDGNSIYLTNDGGITWNLINSNIPLNTYFTYIEISPTNPSHIWITSYGTVYETTNAGVSWASVSAGLPVIPVNCIVHNNNSSNDEVYIGTDMGVYYKDNSMNSWQPYNTNLPPVMIMELEIHYLTGNMRAATFGRGIWESTIINSTPTNLQSVKAVSSGAKVFPNPATEKIIVQVDNVNEQIEGVEIFNTLGQKVLKNNFSYTNQIELGTGVLANGIYNLKVKTNFSLYSQKLIIQGK